MERVRSLVSRARTDSPFYSARLADVDETKLILYSDMESVPFTYPSDIASDPFMFLCVPSREIARVTTLSSSGSAGSAKRIFFTDGDLGRTVGFFSEGMLQLVSENELVVAMISVDAQNSLSDLLRKALALNGARAVIHGPICDPCSAAIAAASADCIVGLPSDMIRMCRMYPHLRPKNVLLTADYVPDCVVKGVADAWRCKVFTHYGLTETGFGCAVQCEAREYHHIRHAELLLEIVAPDTGRQLPPGEIGEIAVTTFAQEAMPLVRYRTGDISSMAIGPCQCGGEFPRLKKVMGRRDNLIWHDEAGHMALGQLDEIVYSFDSVLGYRARVKDAGHKKLYLDVDAKESLDHEVFEGSVRSCLGCARDVEFLYESLKSLGGAGKRMVGR